LIDFIPNVPKSDLRSIDDDARIASLAERPGVTERMADSAILRM
jgi:hypothetical protein